MTDQPSGQPADAGPVPVADPHTMDMRDKLAVASTLIFVGAMAAKYALAWSGAHIDQALATQLNQFDTAALVQWAGVMGYYFGSSKAAPK